MYLLLLFLVPLQSEICNCDINFVCLPLQINGTLNSSVVDLVQVGPVHVGRFFSKTDVALDGIFSFYISVWTGIKNAGYDLCQVYLLEGKTSGGLFFRR